MKRSRNAMEEWLEYKDDGTRDKSNRVTESLKLSKLCPQRMKS